MEGLLQALFDPDTYRQLARDWSVIAYLALSIALCSFGAKGLWTWWIERDGAGFRSRVEKVGREEAEQRVRSVCGWIGVATWFVLWIVVLYYGAR